MSYELAHNYISRSIEPCSRGDLRFVYAFTPCWHMNFTTSGLSPDAPPIATRPQLVCKGMRVSMKLGHMRKKRDHYVLDGR